MKIKINPLDAESITNAIKEVKEYKKWVQEKESMLIERLAMIGADVVRVTFSRAIYAGANDIQVAVNISQHRAKIIANGQHICFIEFGTGVLNSEIHPYADKFGFQYGTYGYGQGKNKDGWIYLGEQGTAGEPVSNKNGVYRTRGNPPAEAFPKAIEEILKSITQVAKEVFR